MADLRLGGFSTYVQASRVTNREGICLIEPITLSDLNKPLPTSLKKENLRLMALEKNTLIHYGFESGKYIDIPDVENEQGTTTQSVKPHWNYILSKLLPK